jgi:hypothetical protein
MSIRKINEQRKPVIAAITLPLLLFLIEVPLQAMPQNQEKPVVQNVRLEFEQDIAIITYDLIAQSGETYDVVASLTKEGDPNFRILVKSATGDIGRGKYAGLQRRIQWEWKKDLPKDFAGGPEYSIEVTASHIEEGGGGSWVYYVLGAAVIGGGAAALLGAKKGGGETSTSSSPLPSTPPGRPF